MKKIYLLLIFVLISIVGFCQTYYVYTATKSGWWNDMSVWSITVRTDGKAKTKVVIPASRNVIVDNNVNSFGLGDVEIQLAGKLNMQSNTTINLSAASSVELVGSGQILGNNNTQKINIGPITKYDGSKDLNKGGASIANASTGVSPLGFTPTTLLAVKLVSFTAEKTNPGILLKWSTSLEISNNYFDVERSYDGNTWNTIATVQGNGTTQTVSSYQYTDNNANGVMVYYRLKQVDIDGQAEFSAVKTINNNGGSTGASKIYAFNKNIFIEPAKEITTAVDVVVMTAGGQLLMKQQYSASGKIDINLSNLNTGSNIVLVNISNSRGLNQSSKLLL
jgi:hypothetical protein